MIMISNFNQKIVLIILAEIEEIIKFKIKILINKITIIKLKNKIKMLLILNKILKALKIFLIKMKLIKIFLIKRIMIKMILKYQQKKITLMY